MAIDYQKEGKIAIFTINRPDALNSINVQAFRELHEAMVDFRDDDGLWAGIITGAGDRAFCAGNDLKHHASEGEAVTLPPTGFAGLTSRFDTPKPLIAAVNGVAMGGGFEIALACDLIVAAESAVFALPEPRVGLAALAGGMHRLPRQIPLKRAMGMLLTGRRVSAREGLELGFVNEVVPDGELAAAGQAVGLAVLDDPVRRDLLALVGGDPASGHLAAGAGALADLVGGLDRQGHLGSSGHISGVHSLLGVKR